MSKLEAIKPFERTTATRWSIGVVLPAILESAWLREGKRLFLGAAGPVVVAGTQFLASLLLWGHVSAKAFGLFAFLILIIQFTQSLSNALVGTPISVAPRNDGRDDHRSACLAAHGLLLAGAVAAIAGIMFLSGAGGSAPAFAVLALTANLRWTARSWAIADEQVAASTLSDSLYAVGVAVLLGLLVISERVSADSVAVALAAANAIALIALSRTFLAHQFSALNWPAFVRYRAQIWPKQASWALVGVVSTEASANAHAYLVTCLCGPATYAPLAFGAMFCRPMMVFLTALNQIDRPIFVRLLSAGDPGPVRRLLNMNFAAVTLVWLGNVAIAVAAFLFFSGKIDARGYIAGDVRLIVCIWFAIMGFRAARNPLATFVQAIRAFQPLAYCSIASGALSILAVLAFTWFGPAYSLLGILSGDALLLALIALLVRKELK